MKFLQKLGKSLMLPVACLPLCGLLMGIGYALCPSTMQGGDVTGLVQMIGLFLVKAGAALIDNMAILFVIGVGVGMSDDNDGTGGVAAIASWFMITTLLNTGFVTTIMPGVAEDAVKTSLVLEEIIDKDHLDVTDKDSDAKIDEISAMYGQPSATIKDMLEKQNAMSSIRQEIMSEKVVKFLKEHNEIV